MSTAKRVFLYIIAIVTLGIFAGGVGNLLSLVLDLIFRSNEGRDFAQGQLAMGLAMLIIGGALWFLFWRLIQRETSGDAGEIGSGIRKLYLNLILGVSAITGLVNLAEFLRWILSGVPSIEFPSSGLAAVIVSGCLWFYHRKIERGEGQPSPEAKVLGHWYVYVLSAFGLIAMTNSIVQLLNSAFSYLPVWGDYTLRGGLWDNVIAVNISWMLVGGLAWWYHWLRLAKEDYDSTLRQVYLHLLAITGGVVAALSAVTTVFYKLFSFAFGGPADAGYFRFLGWTIPLVLVAGGVWIYHRKIVQEEAVKLKINQFSPHRLYLYLMSFIGLGAALSGIVFLFSVLLDLLADAFSSATIFNSGWWSNQLSLSLALMLSGVPVWLYFWRKVLRLADEGGIMERSTRSRRIFLYTVLGVTIIAAVTTLVLIIYQVINGILQGKFETEFLQTVIWSLSVLLAAVPALVYHWRVLREDQKLGAEKLIRRKRVNVVAGEGTEDIISALEKKLGYGVRRLRYTGGITGELSVLSDAEIDKLVNDIGIAAGDGVILDFTGNKIKVLPFEEK
jgi:hypothetical protein